MSYAQFEYLRVKFYVSKRIWGIITDDSTIEYSTNATITAGTGNVELAFTMGKTDRIFEQLREQESEFFPGDTLTLVIYTPGGTSGTFDVALRWKELF